MYTNDKNVQIILGLLKEYGVKKIVASPGTKNVPVVLSVQADPYFDVYSVVDERGAAYFATGLAFESGEPVVIVCTGATASRNYLPGLTEAYYRKLPVIALTCGHQYADSHTLTPQNIDRSVSQNDIKKLTVSLPGIRNNSDYKRSVLLVNEALTTVLKNGGGPVHIDVLTSTLRFSTNKLPEIKKITYLGHEDMLAGGFALLSKKLIGKKVGILIGIHKKFSMELTDAIDTFADKYDVAVFCDHTSSYHGKNRVQVSPKLGTNIKEKPDVMIDIGGVSDVFSRVDLVSEAEIWRISEDGAFIHRNMRGKLAFIFSCSEGFFFKGVSDVYKGKTGNIYFETVYKQNKNKSMPDLPLSNTFISSKMSELLPYGASLHIGILNSLRNMNMFELDDSIDSSCNTGGFGIDGAVSTIVGQSVVNNNRLYFGMIGDLAFFYDMNSLGIRHRGKNIRLLVINNNLGVEFRLNPNLEPYFKEKLDPFTTARGHFGSAKGWAESMGFHYMSAMTKEEFLSLVEEFCDADINHFDKPVLFEVFTVVEDEQQGLKMFVDKNLCSEKKFVNIFKTVKKVVKQIDKFKGIVEK